MKGVYSAAIVTTFLSFAIIGSFLFVKSHKEERAFLGKIILLMLPMCPVAFYFLRLPLDGLLRGLLGYNSKIYVFLTTLYAPIFEEPAKLWIFLIPYFLKRLDSKNIIKVALAIGLGFGIGEMWLVAVNLAKNLQIAKLPWYLLGGYINERFMVCIAHGAFTAVVLKYIRKSFIIGIITAMFLHYLGNFPIYLARNNFWGLGESVWQVILSFWVQIYFLILVGLLIYLAAGNLRMGDFIYGKAECPECKKVYSRPIFAINMVTKRYERCPYCKKYHWT